MAGRGVGGRGSMLRKLLQEMEEKNVEEEIQPAPSTSAATEEVDLQRLVIGRGRARPRPHAPTPSPASAATGPSLVDTVSLGRGISKLKLDPDAENKDSVEIPESKSAAPMTRRVVRAPVIDERSPEIHKGESGKVVPLTANYIRLKCNPHKGMYEYFVRYMPEVDAMRMKYDLLNEHRNVIGETRTFDGAVLYLPEKLPNDETNLKSTMKTDGSTVNITIIFQRKRTLGENVHFYNILFKRIMFMLNFIRFNRSHFDPREAVMIPQHRLEVWPGYVTAIDMYEDGLMVCCDVSSKVLRRVTAYEVIQAALLHNPANYRDEVFKALVGQSVMTTYNKKLYRIDDIDFTKNPSQTFKKRDKEISFVEYYRTAYNVTISDFKQPLLVHRSKKQNLPNQSQEGPLINLIPELCNMTGLTDEMRADFRVMKDIGCTTRINPNERQLYLQKLLNSIRNSADASDLLNRWGLELAEGTIELNGRLLPPENIMFGKSFEMRGSYDADWGRAATSNHMLTVVHMQNWLVICTRKDQRYSHEFIDMMRQVGPQMGMTVANPAIEVINDDRVPTYVNAIRNNIRGDLQIVVIIFPSARDDRYSACKKLCVAETPISSQVINSRTISQQKKLRAVTQKIALQMNCKLGGTLWSVRIPFKNTMICGIDTYHDPTRRGSSWAGIVASMNECMTRWYSQTCEQISGQELINSLRIAFLSCLQRYHKVNGSFPDTVVIFRDGVGDGQMNVCLEFEIPQLMSVLADGRHNHSYKLAFIVVQKRINTRIYTANGRSGGGDHGYENPGPGTVMDNTITRRFFFDFFIVSQHVRQGTVTPTHYVVLKNTTKFTPDQLQKITFKMCHLYYNWPGTVRVPAPCQYAHKLAQLIGQNVKRLHSDLLSDKLFFL